MAAAGCGGSGANVSSETSPEPIRQETERASPSRHTVSFSSKVWIETESEEHDGSTARQKLELGELSPAKGFELASNFANLAGICEINEQRDAVMLGRLIIENTTNEFPIEIQSGVYVGPNPEVTTERPYAEVAQRLGEEPSCLESGGGTEAAGEAIFTVAAGEHIRQNFLIVLHGYYSPSSPKGDKQGGLSELRAKIPSYPPIAGSWETTCLSASAPLDGEAVSLDGGPIRNYKFEGDYSPEELPPC